jgi:hypothetical protein
MGMERPYLGQGLRHQVAARANNLWEYCLIHETDTDFGCAFDHTINLKHGGTSKADNLAYACVFCDRFKGSDIGSVVWETQEFTRFYNPRRDRWAEQLHHSYGSTCACGHHSQAKPAQTQRSIRPYGTHAATSGRLKNAG